jgi:DNA-binding IclR family transcriptional regulator
MLNHFEVIYLAVLDGRGPIKIAVEPGGSITLHSTALGKCLLAYQCEEYIQEYLKATELVAFTERTLSKSEQLVEQLGEIRFKGYAINDGETYEDIGAIAVPLFGPRGQPINLAVSLTYPRHLVTEKRLDIDQMTALGRIIADEISRRCDISAWPKPQI